MIRLRLAARSLPGPARWLGLAPGSRRVAAGLPLLVALAVTWAAPASATPPQTLYMIHCQGCHLADGSGSPGAVPSLAGTLARFLTVPGGRAFLVQVPGSASSPLSDGDLASVLNWMVARFGPEEAAAGARSYEPGEVGKLRATPLIDVEATRRALIAAIRENP